MFIPYLQFIILFIIYYILNRTNNLPFQHDLENLIAIHMKYRFHPSEADKHWVSNAIGEVLDLYYYNYDIKNKTEADLVRRLWGFIEKCFDESDFYVLRYITLFLFIIYDQIETCIINNVSILVEKNQAVLQVIERMKIGQFLGSPH